MKLRVPSRSTAGVFYDVVVGLDGTLECNCPASFNRLECWHIRFVREEMNMTNATKELVPVVVQPSVALLPSSHELDVVERAAAMAYAGAVSLPDGIKTKEQVAAIMLYGLELGLKPMTALQRLYIVKGRVTLSAEVMAGICMGKEKDIRFLIEEISPEKCTIRMVRPSRHVDQPYTVTWKQIQTAGLATETNSKYPEDRLRYHCMKRLCRAYAPDLINNLDEGVALPGFDGEQPWRPTVVEASDLYNEGDEQADEDLAEDIADGVVEDVPMSTDEQLAQVSEWTEALKAKGKAATDAVDAARRAEWPYAIKAGRFSAAALTEAHCADYIAVLADAAGQEIQQPSLVT